jgi:hypothetical protein
MVVVLVRGSRLFTFLCLERRFERVSLIGGASWYLKPSDFTAGQVGQLGVPQPGPIFGEPALTHIEQGESPSDQTFGKGLAYQNLKARI